MNSKKAQSSMILIIIVIMIFVAMIVFLLNLAGSVNRETYTNLYVNNLLLSVMRTDTGYTDSKCKLVSDLVFCAYFTPEWRCGNERCLDLANETLHKYLGVFAKQTNSSMRYLFTVTTNTLATNEGEPITLEMGDASIKTAKATKRYSYPLVLTKSDGFNQHTLKIQLVVAKN